MQAAFVQSLSPSLQAMRVLWLTVLEQAIEDARQPDKSLRRKALEWLLLDNEDFPEICDMAGIDATYLRKRVRSNR